MKTLLIVAGVLFFGSFAHASDSRSMTCAQTRHEVLSRGAVVIYYGDDLYDRYVSSDRYCERDQVTEAAWIPTSDKSECFVGYTCREIYGN